MTWLTEPNTCPGLFYGTPANDGFLLRLRSPGGWLNRQQAEAIATLVESWGLENIQVTNRANLQIRSVPTAPTLQVYQKLQALGLAAHNPNLDHLRNLMASPTAGIDPLEIIDTRPFIQALDTYIQSQPELSGLSAKFSIGMDGGGQVGIGTRSSLAWEHRYNDLQLSAVALDSRIYLLLALGGDIQVLIAPEDCVSVVAALAKVYLDYINIQQTPKKPRLKNLLQDWGPPFYLQQVNKHLSRPLYQIDPVALPPSRSYSYLGVHPQAQRGLSYIGVSLPLGQLTTYQWRGLIELSDRFGPGELRLTPWQSVLIPNIPNPQVPALLENLAPWGLSASGTQTNGALVACAGKPGCAAALTQTQVHGRALSDYLQQRVKFDRPVNIHLTGCPKSCAQSSPAEITLLGIIIDHNGESVEGYRVYRGDQQLADLASADLAPFIEQLLIGVNLPI